MSKNREKKIRKIIFGSDLSETMAKNQGKKLEKLFLAQICLKRIMITVVNRSRRLPPPNLHHEVTLIVFEIDQK